MGAEDPTNAPLARKLLGFRVLLVNAIVIFGAFQTLEWLGETSLKLPGWLEPSILVGLGLICLSFLVTATAAGADLTAHLLRDGQIKRVLLKGGRAPRQIADAFARNGYWLALSPLILVGAAVVLAFAGVVVIGAFLLARGALSRALGG